MLGPLSTLGETVGAPVTEAPQASMKPPKPILSPHKGHNTAWGGGSG